MVGPNEVVVQSWAQLNEELFAGSYQPSLRRYRSTFAFRGVPDAHWPLCPSLWRTGPRFAEREHHLLRNFRKYAYRAAATAAAPADSVWFWLSLGQHHGLPTRLLDWTFSPQVALHFVTCDDHRSGCDGLIQAVDFVKVHRQLPREVRALLEEEGADVFTVETLTRLAPTLRRFSSLSADPFLLFFEPPSLDDRVTNQFALHSVASHADVNVERWLVQRKEIWRRIRIPAGLKGEIRDKLDQANITERVLFPGLDGLSAWLKRQYTMVE